MDKAVLSACSASVCGITAMAVVKRLPGIDIFFLKDSMVAARYVLAIGWVRATHLFQNLHHIFVALLDHSVYFRLQLGGQPRDINVQEASDNSGCGLILA